MLLARYIFLHGKARRLLTAGMPVTNGSPGSSKHIPARIFCCHPSGDLSLRSVRDACSCRLSGCCPHPHFFCSRLLPQALWRCASPIRVLTEKSGFIFIVYSYFNSSSMMRSASIRRILNKIGFGELKTQ